MDRQAKGVTVRGLSAALAAAALMAGCNAEPADRSRSGAAAWTPASWTVDWEAGAAEARVRAERAARQAADRSADYLRSRPPPPQSAPAFAAAIRYSRDHARRSGARAIPADVRRALAPYFPRQTLDQVRWTLPSRGPDIGSLLVGWYFDKGAVTLDDVVVFSDTRLAQDPLFWAHELAHVEQYRRLGVDGFARRYMNDWQSLEREARDKTLVIRKEMRRRS